MDVSKLPKLSQTPPAPPPNAPDAANAIPATPAHPVDDAEAYLPRGPGLGAEVWLSAAVGLILMVLGRSFAKWFFATMTGSEYLTGSTWSTGSKAGQPVDYWELMGYPALTDCGLFLFGLALVLEAIVLAVALSKFRAKLPLVGLALLITLSATIFNAIVVVVLFKAGIMPLISLLAVAFGVYIASYEWRLFQVFSAMRAARRA